MKKQDILLLIFVVLTGRLHAQKNKEEILFFIGPSFPVGHFASTKQSDQLAGYAKTGMLLNLSFSHRFNNVTGIEAILYVQGNGLKTNVYDQQLSKSGFYFQGNGSPPDLYPNWNVHKKNWYLESFLLGITQEIPLTTDSKFAFTGKILIGVAYLQLPKFEAESITDTSLVTINQNAASGFGLSYTGRAGMSYKWSKTIDFLIDAGYFGTSRIRFKQVRQTVIATNGGFYVPGIPAFSNSRYPISSFGNVSDNEQPVGSLQVNIGIRLKL